MIYAPLKKASIPEIISEEKLLSWPLAVSHNAIEKLRSLVLSVLVLVPVPVLLLVLAMMPVLALVLLLVTC